AMVGLALSGPKHVARGEVARPQRLAEQFRLGSLSDPRRPQQHQPIRTSLGCRCHVALRITTLEPRCTIRLLSHSRLLGGSLAKLPPTVSDEVGQKAKTCEAESFNSISSRLMSRYPDQSSESSLCLR